MASVTTLKDRAAATDSNVEKTINSFKNSKLGKKIPMRIDGMSLTGIINALLVSKAFYATPAYLITNWTASSSTKIVNSLGSIFSMLFIFVLLSDLVAAGAIYGLKIKLLFLVGVILMLIKNGLLLFNTMPLLFSHMHFISFISYFVFLFATLLIDALFSYYLSIYIHTENGEPQNEEVNAEKIEEKV